jgi:hypothetical protein
VQVCGYCRRQFNEIKSAIFRMVQPESLGK